MIQIVLKRALLVPNCWPTNEIGSAGSADGADSDHVLKNASCRATIALFMSPLWIPNMMLLSEAP